MEYLHRDIKPSNVLLSGDLSSGSFVAKLTDFGLAAKLNPASSEEELTAETGTYRYMSPEVIRHENYSYAADVFSYAMLVGAGVVFELLSNLLTFVCRNPQLPDLGNADARKAFHEPLPN